MTVLKITLDESTAAFVERECQARGLDTPAKYIEWVLAEEQRSLERQPLENLLLEGLDSGPGRIADEEYWRVFHQRLQTECDVKVAQ